ncbi:MAG TPA: PAS domain S-box protein [Solirubrobacteraceae bacterium]|jgi:PAS domain S-box-containing protein
MGGLLRGTKELLAELEVYDQEQVEQVMGRLAAAIGGTHAADVNLTEHVLGVVETVMSGRARHDLTRLLGARLERSDELLWLVDEQRVVLAASPAAAASLGYQPEELVGRSTEHMRGSGQDLSEARTELAVNGHHEGLVLARHRCGHDVPVRWRGRVVTLAGRTLYFIRTHVIEAEDGNWYVGLATGLAACLFQFHLVVRP